MHEINEWKGSNSLWKEKSPYLLQHQHNPVWWQAWGDESLALARRLDRPIFLSIGYATCHWCHVMERESFEHPEIAAKLNQGFVCIKVDREELPDVDAIYMMCLHVFGERGGWPLNVFLSPELKPFFGGTYFRPAEFSGILDNMKRRWLENRDHIMQSGEALTAHLSNLQTQPTGELTLDKNLLLVNLEKKKREFDAQWGGFGGCPKFPPSIQCRVLLRTFQRTGDTAALVMVERTLEGMARGGMYDHVGGGFARYSTDYSWFIPHFEKMLYDNALIARTYLEAHQVIGKPWFAEVARETLEYVLRDMTHAEGGFYSAEDADSEGEEGIFYLFTPEDLVPVLEPRAISKMCEYFEITPRGTYFDGKSILRIRRELDWSIKEDPVVKDSLARLLELRGKRIRPLRDDKILTSWNGLMIDTFAYAFRVLQDKRYLQAAERAAHFIQTHLWDGEKLLRRWREGEAIHAGTVQDYAWLIQGLLGLYEAGRDERWARWARSLQEIQDRTFYVPKQKAYAMTPLDAPHMIVRTVDLLEGATPNANGVSAQNLQKLAGLFGEPALRELAERLLESGGILVEKHPDAFGSVLLALDDYLRGGVELVAALNPDSQESIDKGVALQQAWLPGVTLAWSDGKTGGLPCTEGRSAGKEGSQYYLCRRFTCLAPKSELEEVLTLAQEP